MGAEAQCLARCRDNESRGWVRLESDRLIFRGDFRLAIPFGAIKSVRASGNELRVTFPDGTARFEIGAPARAWVEKILHPKSLLDKLGVKPGAMVSVLGAQDAAFRRDIATRAREVAENKPKRNSDLIFFAAENRSDLKRPKQLRGSIKLAGAIWAVYPKGQARITQADVMAAARRAGLVDVKVVSFSATHTAHRLVIPVARRSRAS